MNTTESKSHKMTIYPYKKKRDLQFSDPYVIILKNFDYHHIYIRSLEMIALRYKLHLTIIKNIEIKINDTIKEIVK